MLTPIEWTKLWTQFQNEYFEDKGLDLRVDQKGVISQIHLGPLRMRSKGAYNALELQDKRLGIAGELAKNPDEILKHLTQVYRQNISSIPVSVYFRFF